MEILLIGYGNPGRLDDGLGPAFAEKIQTLEIPGVAVESNYQLNIEDADLIAGFDVVVFADASVNAAEPFEFQPLEKKVPMVGFSSHSITAGSLLGLAEELFGASPQAYTMAIRGYDFDEFGEWLSAPAQANLEAAASHLVPLLLNGFSVAEQRSSAGVTGRGARGRTSGRDWRRRGRRR